MVTDKVTPMERGGQAPRGQMTYAGIAAIVIFVIFAIAIGVRTLAPTQSPQGAPERPEAVHAPATP